jgi:FtsP/CotA-like multicopper oxidase with cupredoxin domain
MSPPRRPVRSRARGPVALAAAGLASFLNSGCADLEESAPDGPDLADPTPALDTDPDPDVVEVWLTATLGTVEYLPGKPAQVWAYRDGAAPGSAPQVPGPLVEAKLGDLVRVHLVNELDEGTTLHMHGARLAAHMDGVHELVFPGTRFDYELVAQDSGALFYHPHLSSDEQMERGLHGPIFVRSGAAARPPGERVLVLDDVKLGADGDLAGEWTEEDIAHGRRGNLLLVNGRPSPTLRAAAGEVQRWHLINASNGRYFQLAAGGRRFEVLGWDSGSLAEPYETEALLIAPGERLDVTIDLGGTAGDRIDVYTMPYDRGEGLVEAEEVLFRVALGGGPPADASPAGMEPIAPLGAGPDAAVRSFVLAEDLDGEYGPLFFINGEIWPFNTPIAGALGALEVWDVRNESAGDHPFHLHGMRFQVLSRGGEIEPRLGWKDTVNIRPGEAVRFAVRYEAEGHWMYHCQIPEHAERGMMGEIHVVAAP